MASFLSVKPPTRYWKIAESLRDVGYEVFQELGIKTVEDCRDLVGKASVNFPEVCVKMLYGKYPAIQCGRFSLRIDLREFVKGVGSLETLKLISCTQITGENPMDFGYSQYNYDAENGTHFDVMTESMWESVRQTFHQHLRKSKIVTTAALWNFLSARRNHVILQDPNVIATNILPSNGYTSNEFVLFFDHLNFCLAIACPVTNEITHFCWACNCNGCQLPTEDFLCESCETSRLNFLPKKPMKIAVLEDAINDMVKLEPDGTQADEWQISKELNLTMRILSALVSLYTMMNFQIIHPRIMGAIYDRLTPEMRTKCVQFLRYKTYNYRGVILSYDVPSKSLLYRTIGMKSWERVCVTEDCTSPGIPNFSTCQHHMHEELDWKELVVKTMLILGKVDSWDKLFTPTNFNLLLREIRNLISVGTSYHATKRLHFRIENNDVVIVYSKRPYTLCRCMNSNCSRVILQNNELCRSYFSGTLYNIAFVYHKLTDSFKIVSNFTQISSSDTVLFRKNNIQNVEELNSWKLGLFLAHVVECKLLGRSLSLDTKQVHIGKFAIRVLLYLLRTSNIEVSKHNNYKMQFNRRLFTYEPTQTFAECGHVYAGISIKNSVYIGKTTVTDAVVAPYHYRAKGIEDRSRFPLLFKDGIVRQKIVATTTDPDMLSNLENSTILAYYLGQYYLRKDVRILNAQLVDLDELTPNFTDIMNEMIFLIFEETIKFTMKGTLNDFLIRRGLKSTVVADDL